MELTFVSQEAMDVAKQWPQNFYLASSSAAHCAANDTGRSFYRYVVLLKLSLGYQEQRSQHLRLVGPSTKDRCPARSDYAGEDIFL